MQAPSVTTVPTKVQCEVTGFGVDGKKLDQFMFDGGVSKTHAVLSSNLTHNADEAIAKAIEVVTVDCNLR